VLRQVQSRYYSKDNDGVYDLDIKSFEKHFLEINEPIFHPLSDVWCVNNEQRAVVDTYKFTTTTTPDSLVNAITLND
jgi:hypothetical protein